MPETTNQGAYRISGRFGECYRNGILLIEVTAVEANIEIGVTDVPLVGMNRNGTKDGPEERAGSLTIQAIDMRWENEIYDNALSYSLAERRRRRDSGQRVSRTFTMQTWLDDPEALGAIGWQLEDVRINRLPMGFNLGDELTNREFPFRWENERRIRAFERIANQTDPETGLPAIRYTHGAPVI